MRSNLLNNNQMYVLYGYCGGGIFPAGHRLPRGAMLMAEVWPSSSHINTVGILGQLVVGVEIWAPGNISIHLFPRLFMYMVTLKRTF